MSVSRLGRWTRPHCGLLALRADPIAKVDGGSSDFLSPRPGACGGWPGRRTAPRGCLRWDGGGGLFWEAGCLLRLDQRMPTPDAGLFPAPAPFP